MLNRSLLAEEVRYAVIRHPVKPCREVLYPVEISEAHRELVKDILQYIFCLHTCGHPPADITKKLFLLALICSTDLF